jgi:leader peptidase (prepilin peptidase) / N-methyltransferase
MNREAVVTTDLRESRSNDLARSATVAVAVLLSTLTAIRYGMRAETVVLVFVVCVLTVIARVDLERRVIPNRIVLPAWFAILLAHLALHPGHWLEWLVGSFGVGLLFLAIVLLYPAGMGMGDVKLALLIGAALGYASVSALLFGTVGAGLVAAVMLFKEGSAARKRAIPLGPFLAGGAVVVLLLF